MENTKNTRLELKIKELEARTSEEVKAIINIKATAERIISFEVLKETVAELILDSEKYEYLSNYENDLDLISDTVNETVDAMFDDLNEKIESLEKDTIDIGQADYMRG